MLGQETEGGGQVGTTAGPHGWETEEKAGEEGRWPHAQAQRDSASLGGHAINSKVRLATRWKDTSANSRSLHLEEKGPLSS